MMDLDAEYSEYKAYIEDFAKTIDPNDQLPLRVSGYCLRDYEIHGEVLDWVGTYLGKCCPITLRMYLIQTSINRTLEKVKDAPEECGFDTTRHVYQPLKLVRVVVSIVNSIILDLQDNAKLYEVPLPPNSPNATELTKLKEPPKYCVDAIKNTRRTMEDKHMIIDDFNAFFNTQDTEPTFYYGIFDGHAGSDAASYANSHLNYNIAVHPKYPSDIVTAMREAFLVTDVSFLKKAKAENLNSGTTALCAMYRKTEKKLYVGWCGDSQALIARVGNVRQIVKKHSPEDESERKRIEKLGGVVLYWGNSYRVNGALGVSRAIGDMSHKPYVSAEPEIECINLDGEEDFIVLGCDGLWDALTEDDVAITVYKRIQENPDSYRSVASELCQLAKSQGSKDNISVIVVYLKEPHLIATQSWPSTIEQTKDIMENLNMYEEPPVSNPVTMDALGNTNQDIYNNPFGDYSNQFINDVAIGKSTEITDLVMQQQPENAFCNLTDTMNNINNNKFNNGHDENNFMVDDVIHEEQPVQQEVQNVLVLNDDNNNSNDNFGGPDMGPETDVDTIDEQFQLNAAVGGHKEKTQMEFKETEDVADRADIMNFGEDHSAAIYGTLENKIFEEMTLQNPDLMRGNNPFAEEEAGDVEPVAIIAEAIAPVEAFMDNKFMEEEIQQHVDDFAEKMDNLVSEELNNALETPSAAVEEELIRANMDDAMQQQQLPADLGFVGSTHQATGESGGEDSEDEWNYIKVDKKSTDGLAAVEETVEPNAESPIAEEKEEETAPINNQLSDFEEHSTDFDKELEHQTIESPTTDKDFEQEKEQAIVGELVEEERHIRDDFEKDLQLSIETEESDEMSQLNPDAKEFIPISPTRTGPMSPPINGEMNPVNTLLSNFVAEDSVVSQSPRKGEFQAMEDVAVPTETDFDFEADSRPHEVNMISENGGGFQRIESPEKLNLKESMQQDDKLEQEYKDEAFFEEEKQQTGDEYKVLESSFNEYSNNFQSIIDDPMNRSFYEGRDDGDILTAATNSSDILNSVQPIPTFEDEQPEADHQNFVTESEKPEADLLCSIGSADFQQELKTSAPPMESSDNFEAERFVEEIKSANSEFDKYVDQGLSPTLPDFTLNTIQTVQETIIVEKAASLEQIQDTNLDTFVIDTSTVSDMKAPEELHEQPEIEVTPTELIVIPEVTEPVVVAQEAEQIVVAEVEAEQIVVPEAEPEPVPEPEKVVVEEKVDVLAEAVVVAVAVGAVVGVTAAQKKPFAKTEVKKTDVKPKTVPAKTNPVPAKRVPAATTTKPPAPKPSSASSTTAKAPAPRKIAPVTAAPAPRPKPTSTTTAPAKKPITSATSKTVTDMSANKPTPASRTVTLTKKPAVSVTAAKPPSRPTSASVPAKPKLTNGSTERKTSATESKAALTKTLTAAKPKLNGIPSTAKSPTKPMTSARLSTSTAEKSSVTPIKDSTLNKSLTSARPTRPVTSAAAKTTVKDLKSPSATAPKTTSSLSAAGVKKPLSAIKKSPISGTTTTTVITKKPATKTTIAKKTTTTTTVVQKKKVVNGDVIVSEETTTTKTTSGDPQLIEDILKDGLASEMNGHMNGNGIMENGSGEGGNIQMVLDSAAD